MRDTIKERDEKEKEEEIVTFSLRAEEMLAGFRAQLLENEKSAATISKYLGFFNRLEDAAAARKEAEQILAQGTHEHYQKWRAMAEKDPAWGRENPMKIQVQQKQGGDFSIQFLPPIPQ